MFIGHSSALKQVAFADEGKTVISISADNGIYFWKFHGDASTTPVDPVLLEPYDAEPLLSVQEAALEAAAQLDPVPMCRTTPPTPASAVRRSQVL